MARVINRNSPGKRRGHLMRTVAEIQRRLLRKQAVDEDVKDMLAMAVFCLREIGETVRETVDAWDERGYWKKAADFETGWEWAGETADEIETILRGERWEALPGLLIALAGRTAAIEVNTFTRKETLWKGCFRKLMEDS